MKYSKGLVLGKFMPPHKGHEYLFRFAKEYCDELTIVVDCLKQQTISPELRKKWIEELVIGVNVVALDEFMPQDPLEIETFWEIWKNKLYSVAGKPDVLIAAMDYGWELAKHLNCDFVPLDIARQSVPISSTEIRQKPFDYWNFIIESARGYFMKKICLIGPESTGKSTICEKLAKKYNTVYIPEYAKAIIKYQHGHFYEENVKQVALAQIRTEKALERMTNKIMFCDSDIITTIVWAETLFGKHDLILDEIANNQHYDMTFLFYPDTTWLFDEHRNLSNSSLEFRLNMFEEQKKLLEKYNRKYMILYGSFDEKEKKIEEYISDLIFIK